METLNLFQSGPLNTLQRSACWESLREYCHILLLVTLSRQHNNRKKQSINRRVFWRKYEDFNMNENEKQKKNSKTRDLNKKQCENNDLFLWKRAPWLYLKWSGSFGEVQNVNDKSLLKKLKSNCIRFMEEWWHTRVK